MAHLPDPLFLFVEEGEVGIQALVLRSIAVLMAFPFRPTDNDRYVRNAPDNPKKVCLFFPKLLLNSDLVTNHCLPLDSIPLRWSVNPLVDE